MVEPTLFAAGILAAARIVALTLARLLPGRLGSRWRGMDRWSSLAAVLPPGSCIVYWDADGSTLTVWVVPGAQSRRAAQ